MDEQQAKKMHHLAHRFFVPGVTWAGIGVVLAVISFILQQYWINKSQETAALVCNILGYVFTAVVVFAIPAIIIGVVFRYRWLSYKAAQTEPTPGDEVEKEKSDDEQKPNA